MCVVILPLRRGRECAGRPRGGRRHKTHGSLPPISSSQGRIVAAARNQLAGRPARQGTGLHLGIGDQRNNDNSVGTVRTSQRARDGCGLRSSEEKYVASLIVHPINLSLAGHYGVEGRARPRGRPTRRKDTLATAVTGPLDWQPTPRSYCCWPRQPHARRGRRRI